jgi:hypothetical protein
MRNTAVIILSGIVLLTQALIAHAEGGGPVTPPAVGTENPAPPAAGSDIGAPLPQKPALKGNNALGTNGAAADNQAAGPVATDTSTAAPGGQAESSRNGALSSPPDAASPPDGKPVHPDNDRQKPANKAGEETPK